MIGVKSQFTDKNGKEIYSGQKLSNGFFNANVYWNKDIGFRFRGQMLTQYILEKYEIIEDISWFSKILPKWVK